ncbi:MAG TPA: DUF3472 domain-containing protein [Fibrobacteria bacterium]|nr:DUF3472 domain-containing protein [Fibrobacteria bacterium]
MKRLGSIPAGLLLAIAGETAAQNSAPSSHMVFASGSKGDILVNEVRVPGKTMYTYYETLGWGGSAGGYAGIQEHPNGRNFIFSIWDNPEHKAPIRSVFTGHGTTTEKFGGEGTGLKSWNFKLPWASATWYALAARAWPVGQDTYYGMWVRDGVSGKWRHLITMDVAAANSTFNGGLDAFIEDWSSTGTSRRETNIRGAWKRTTAGAWESLGNARYSVNGNDLAAGGRSYNFRGNWDGGKARDATGDYFYMVAGGSATAASVSNPSTHAIPRVEVRPAYAPLAADRVAAVLLGTDRVAVSWEIDSLKLPQFRYVLEAFDNPGFAGKPLSAAEETAPDKSADTLALPAAGQGAGTVYGRLTLIDLFDNRAVYPAFTLRNGSLAAVRPAAGAARGISIRSRAGSVVLASAGAETYSVDFLDADGRIRYGESGIRQSRKEFTFKAVGLGQGVHLLRVRTSKGTLEAVLPGIE